MWTIEQRNGNWELSRAGVVMSSWGSYELALNQIAVSMTTDVGLTAAGGTGLLEETWVDNGGIAFSEVAPDGRDFTNAEWIWRDPEVSQLPLMLQTCTEMGHFGAVLAGYMETITLDGTTPRSSGRFYDSEAGVQFRDMLQDSRKFGVSVDGGPNCDVEWVCDVEDEDGWCMEEHGVFNVFEIIGLTGTPFPAFPAAAIILDAGETPDVEAESEAEPNEEKPETEAAITASAFPASPPAEWMTFPEPAHGDPMLVQQRDNTGELGEAWAVPLTILDSGQVFGHLAYWGQCHVGYTDVCVTPPTSPSEYSQMNLRPTVCDDGSTVLTGPLVVGCDHADLRMFTNEARDHYANAGVAWADVHVIDGEFGPWVTGALRPDITPEQLRVLRSSSISGDWRDFGSGLDLMIGLTVNGPGFPVQGQALAASGLEYLSKPHRRVRAVGGTPLAMVASNIVRRECKTCGDGKKVDLSALVAEQGRMLAVIERRTRHLAGVEAVSLTERFTGR